MDAQPESTCSCPCLCCGPSSSPPASWRLSLKRKLTDYVTTSADVTSSARIEMGTEAAALRETLGSHQASIQSLYAELEEERSSAATAASEAMSMILRLQREKAETQMEFRQFKRLAEEKMSHDKEEIAFLEDLIFRKEEALEVLSCEIQFYKNRLMVMSSDPASAMAAAAFDYDFDCGDDSYEYPSPPLSCRIHSQDGGGGGGGGVDLEKYAFGETPCNSSSSHVKGVVEVNSSSAQGQTQARRFSGVDGEEYPFPVWEREEDGDDEEGDDRVYTVDKVHCHHYAKSSCVSTPREFGKNGNGGGGEEEIKRLYMRLQALEADREVMRETITAMGKDKEQMMLLKEIAEKLGKDAVSQKPLVILPVMQQHQLQKMIVKKASFIRSFSIVAALKWIISFIFWRRKSSPIRYTFGMTCSNVGLLLLLDRSARLRQRQCPIRMLR